MKFSLAAALFAATALAAPASLNTRGDKTQLKCVYARFSMGSQTFQTQCASQVIDDGSVVISSTPNTKNFVACISSCAASTDAGTFCQGVEFARLNNQCTLYSYTSGLVNFPRPVKGSDPTTPGYVTALAIQQAPGT